MLGLRKLNTVKRGDHEGPPNSHGKFLRFSGYFDGVEPVSTPRICPVVVIRS